MASNPQRVSLSLSLSMESSLVLDSHRPSRRLISRLSLTSLLLLTELDELEAGEPLAVCDDEAPLIDWAVFMCNMEPAANLASLILGPTFTGPGFLKLILAASD